MRMLALLLLAPLQAFAAPDAVFDGARAFSAVAAPVRAGVPKAAGPSLTTLGRDTSSPYGSVVALQEKPAPRIVEASPSAGKLTSGFLGLYPEAEFDLGTGRCVMCRAPEEGKWYFLDDVIATPKSGPAGLVWIGSKEMHDGVRLNGDGTATLKDGTKVAFGLVEKIATNRSYWDASSFAYMAGRTIRVRGELVVKDGVKTLVARTVWPEDWRIDAASVETGDAVTASDIDALVAADKGGAQKPFMARLLWEKPGAGRAWEGKAVMGLMLNGAQGDDHEALAGHSSLFTGRFGPGGSMADWMFDNFYDMNTASEKGIVASMVPMDKYMADLNSGQSWYRPTYVFVMVMKDARVPLKLQERFKAQYADYYAQKLKYDNTSMNCTALISDPVRSEGWNFPETGKTPKPLAKLISKAVGLAAKDPAVGENIYQRLREEPTRSFPRAGFNAAAGDALSLAGAFGAEPLGRELSPLETQIREDVEAILFLRLPQLPSSRDYGRDPAGGVMDYFLRVPRNRDEWRTHPSVPRPFPPPGAPTK